MKPPASRLLLDAYAVRNDMAVRYSDIDPQMHINNVSIGNFYEEIRTVLNRRMFDLAGPRRRARIVVAHASISYIKEGRYPGILTGGAAVGSIGRRSWVVAQALFQKGECIGTADHTLVYLPEDGATSFPEDLRQAMESLLLKAPQPASSSHTGVSA